MKKLMGWFLAVGITTLGLIFGEGWIIATVVMLGFVKAFFAFSIMFITICFVILYLSGSEGNGVNKKIKLWVDHKERTLQPWLKTILQSSKVLGFIVFSVIIGPVLTTLVFKGRDKRNNYLLAIISSCVFCLAWSAVYGGLIEAIKSFIHRI